MLDQCGVTLGNGGTRFGNGRDRPNPPWPFRQCWRNIRRCPKPTFDRLPYRLAHIDPVPRNLLKQSPRYPHRHPHRIVRQSLHLSSDNSNSTLSDNAQTQKIRAQKNRTKKIPAKLGDGQGMASPSDNAGGLTWLPDCARGPAEGSAGHGVRGSGCGEWVCWGPADVGTIARQCAARAPGHRIGGQSALDWHRFGGLQIGAYATHLAQAHDRAEVAVFDYDYHHAFSSP